MNLVINLYACIFIPFFYFILITSIVTYNHFEIKIIWFDFKKIFVVFGCVSTEKNWQRFFANGRTDCDYELYLMSTDVTSWLEINNDCLSLAQSIYKKVTRIYFTNDSLIRGTSAIVNSDLFLDFFSMAVNEQTIENISWRY